MTDYQATPDKKTKATNVEKKLEKVITGEVVVKKPSIGTRFKKIFLGGDMDTAANYVVGTVILPAIRQAIVEAVSKGVEQLFYGQSARPSRPTHLGSRVQYHNPTIRPEHRYIDRQPNRWVDNSRDADRVMVMTRADAEAVVDQLTEAVDTYDNVSKADLNELLGLPSPHIDHKWGWTNMAGVQIRQTREGYEISFPPLEEL